MNVGDQDIETRTKLPKDECNAQNVLSMLLIDDRLVVFAGGWCPQDGPEEPGDDIRIAQSSVLYPPIYGTSITKIIIFDTSDLRVVGEPLTLQGNYINARAIGDDVYVVTSRDINIYTYLGGLDPWMIAYETDPSGIQRISASDYEEKAWEIAEDTVDTFVEQLVADLDCETLQQITLFQNTDTFFPYRRIMESIAMINGFTLSNPSSMSTSSRVMPTSSWQLYASEDTMVLSAEGYWFGDNVDTETFILAYGLRNGQVAPLGLGTIPGYLLNQFSIDEHNGYLRFASSIRQRWRWFGEGDIWQSESVDEGDNMVIVLEVPNGDDTNMRQVGELKGLGKPGERIYSVRFQEDRAFVVRW